jgi:murein L,D-transpeptidase YcbB/YkuD
MSLFARARRDFSHGCVRVEDAFDLAEWVLAGQDSWTRAAIDAAAGAQRSTRVDLARPIQVLLFYSTAWPVAEGGAIRFADDIYGRDAALETALARRHST